MLPRWTQGQEILLGQTRWTLGQRLGDQAWQVHEPARQAPPLWLWVGELPWSQALIDALPSTKPEYGLPATLEHGSFDHGHAWLILQPGGQALRAFDPDLCRTLEPGVLLGALKQLAKAIDVLHRASVTLGGPERAHLMWDGQTLCPALMPRAGTMRGMAEEKWRDLRCVGELLMEYWTGEQAPHGQAVARLVQDKQALRRAGLTQPGLAQLIAGCVTPYGDAALGSAQAVWASLELLERELAPRVEFQVASRSTLGNYIFRKNNQDACAHLLLDDMCGSMQRHAGIFCVADGIGGLDDGELASRCAAQSSSETFMRFWLDSDIRHQMFKAPNQAARAIAQHVSGALAEEAMNRRHQEVGGGGEEPWPADFSIHGKGGTTFSALLVMGRLFGIAHVGDSRIYLHRAGRLLQLTEDHTLMALLEELSRVDPDKAPSGPVSKSTIARFLNTRQEIEPARIDSFSLDACDTLGMELDQALGIGIPWQVGDRFLLTSDGAHGEIPDEQLQKLLGQEVPLQQVCASIFEAGVRAMGTDNITVMVVGAQAQPTLP